MRAREEETRTWDCTKLKTINMIVGMTTLDFVHHRENVILSLSDCSAGETLWSPPFYT